MFRSPLVLEVQARRELIEEELAKLREVPYSLWRDMLGQTVRKTTTARDNRAYRIRTSVDFATGTDNIRVTLALESGRLGRRLLSQSFVITPENQFQE